MLAVAQVMTPAMQQALMPVARYAASHLECEHPIALLRDWETLMSFNPQTLPMWHALMELLLTGKGELRSRPDKI